MASIDEKENSHKPPWSQLLPELVSMICHRLCPTDVPRFRAVCKHWNSCALPVYPADSTPILISNTISDSGLIRCYSPYLNKMFIVRTPLRAPESRIFSAAVNGWIVLRRPDKTVMFGSLLDGSAFETTESKYNDGYFWASNEDGTGHPEQCGIIAIYAYMYSAKVQSWNGERWKYFGGLLDDDDSSDDSDSDSDFDYDSGSDSASDLDSDSDCNSDSDSNSNSQSDTDNDEEDDDEEEEEENLEQKVEEEDEEDNVVNEYREFTMSCNPVLHKGLWYCLGEDGSLGVYDPNRINWHVLREPSSFGPEFPYQNCYLAACSLDGQEWHTHPCAEAQREGDDLGKDGLTG